MTRMFVVLCALTLAGCGAAKIDSPANARAEYQKSVDDEYRACINDNLKNVEKCQAKRALYWKLMSAPPTMWLLRNAATPPGPPSGPPPPRGALKPLVLSMQHK